MRILKAASTTWTLALEWLARDGLKRLTFSIRDRLGMFCGLPATNVRNHEEATAKHTKDTKSIARDTKPRSVVPFFRLKLTLEIKSVGAQVVPLELQFFVLFVYFVVASL